MAPRAGLEPATN